MNIRTGIDIVGNKRVERLLLNKRSSFYRRIFTEAEQDYLEMRNHNPLTAAGMFAAKEAVSKLLGTGIGPISWKDIEILHENSGRPYINPSPVLFSVMKKMGVESIEISISNEDEFSIAIASALHKETIVIPSDMQYRLPVRNLDSHKGDYGRVGIIGGSPGMTGAVYLASYGALKSGAGLVYSIVELGLGSIIASYSPEVIIKEADDLYVYKLALENLDVLVVGPGLGIDKKKKELVEEVLLSFQNPVVIDADGLNILSENISILRHLKQPVIVTPHPGEMARLLKISVEEVQSDRERYAVEFAKSYGVVTVLKGHKTVVSDGARVYINETGNPGMATAGSGDVLSGIAGTMLAHKEDPYEAAVLAVFIHGMAGDLAKAEVGEYGMVASDILNKIPEAILTVVE